jgi:hypothetical protein
LPPESALHQKRTDTTTGFEFGFCNTIQPKRRDKSNVVALVQAASGTIGCAFAYP